MDETNLHSILKETVAQGVDLFSCRLLRNKPDYQVWDVTLQNPSLRMVVKLAGPGSKMSARFERTAAIHRLVQEQTTIPMPEVVLADESCRKWPWKIFIKTYVPGEEFAAVREQMSEAESEAAMLEIGDAVAQLHSIRFAGFGDVGADGQVEAPKRCLEGMKAHAERILVRLGKDVRQEHFFAALTPREHLFGGVKQACLCHEDLHHHNILFERRKGSWRLATILDFEKAWAGLADSDLARMDLWSMTGEAFWRAYTARMPLDAGYPARRALLQYLWCLEVAWDTPDHRATTAAVLQELENQ